MTTSLLQLTFNNSFTPLAPPPARQSELTSSNAVARLSLRRDPLILQKRGLGYLCGRDLLQRRFVQRTCLVAERSSRSVVIAARSGASSSGGYKTGSSRTWTRNAPDEQPRRRINTEQWGDLGTSNDSEEGTKKSGYRDDAWEGTGGAKEEKQTRTTQKSPARQALSASESDDSSDVPTSRGSSSTVPEQATRKAWVRETSDQRIPEGQELRYALDLPVGTRDRPDDRWAEIDSDSSSKATSESLPAGKPGGSARARSFPSTPVRGVDAASARRKLGNDGEDEGGDWKKDLDWGGPGAKAGQQLKSKSKPRAARTVAWGDLSEPERPAGAGSGAGSGSGAARDRQSSGLPAGRGAAIQLPSGVAVGSQVARRDGSRAVPVGARAGAAAVPAEAPARAPAETAGEGPGSGPGPELGGKTRGELHLDWAARQKELQRFASEGRDRSGALKEPKAKKVKIFRRSEATCYGCGAMLQTREPEAPGFVPLAKYEEKRRHHQLRTLLCTRCQLLAQGQMVPAVSGHGGYGNGKGFVSADELRERLLHLRHERALIVKLVDIVDFNGSFLTRVRDIVGNNPIILVATKVDLLPEGTNLEAVGDWIVDAMLRKKLNAVSVHMTSAKARSGISHVAAAVLRERLGRDVYVLGAANVGKSAFVSALLEEMSAREPLAAAAMRRMPIQSAMPGTTLGPIQIKAFAGGGKLHDTPGVHLHHRMPAAVLPADLPLLAPTRRLRGYVASPPAATVDPAADVAEVASEEGASSAGLLDDAIAAFWSAAPLPVVLEEPPALEQQLQQQDEEGEAKEQEKQEQRQQQEEEEEGSAAKAGREKVCLDWDETKDSENADDDVGEGQVLMSASVASAFATPSPFGGGFGGFQAFANEDLEAEVEEEEARRASGLQGYSLMWGGVARMDVLEAPPSVRFTFYGASAIRIRTVPTAEADDYYRREVGNALKPGTMRDGDTESELEASRAITLETRVGLRPAGDIAISGLGWITVSGVSANDTPDNDGDDDGEDEGFGAGGDEGHSRADGIRRVRLVVHVPRGVEMFVRPPMPIGELGAKWYTYADLSEEEETARPKVFCNT